MTCPSAAIAEGRTSRAISLSIVRANRDRGACRCFFLTEIWASLGKAWRSSDRRLKEPGSREQGFEIEHTR